MTDQPKPPLIGVGMPAWLYLVRFGELVNDAFGDYPFLVGSAAVGKQWRDVDVRLVLADEDYERIIGRVDIDERDNPRCDAFGLAFSELGRKMTGLPIDFQIQRRSSANRMFPSRPRHALFDVTKFYRATPVKAEERNEEHDGEQ